MKYYSYDNIDKQDATYNLIIGQRANGKTYGALKKIIDAYIDEQLPSAYIRRLDEQVKPKYIQNLFNPLLDHIQQRTNGRYNAIVYRSNSFFLAHIVHDTQIKDVQDKKPFCRTYSINTAETSKGADAGEIKYIVFDEFITRAFYIQNEFILYQNLLSSIIRNRSGVKIYMLANTVNKHCPYFRDMGLINITKQKQGTIDIYRIGSTETKIAVEYCAESELPPTVSQYFAFDNPELQMISRGAWEIALYRHPPKNCGDYPILLSFFILFDNNTIQGDIYQYKGYPIIVYHPKTGDLKNIDRSIVYAQETFDGNPLHQIDILYPGTAAHKLILSLIRTQKTFYSDNETGEIIANWLKSQATGLDP